MDLNSILKERLNECKRCSTSIFFNGVSWRHIEGDNRTCDILHEPITYMETVSRRFLWFKWNSTRLVENAICKHCSSQLAHHGYGFYRGLDDSSYCGITAVPKGV